MLRYRTFTTEIYAEYRTSFDNGGASLVACVLLLLCLIVLALEFRLRGRARYERVDRGARRAALRYELGRWRWPVVGGYALLAIVTLVVPLGMIGFWLTQEGAAAVTPAEVSPKLLLDATMSSVGFGLLAALVTVVLAFPLALLLVRYPGRIATAMERLYFRARRAWPRDCAGHRVALGARVAAALSGCDALDRRVRDPLSAARARQRARGADAGATASRRHRTLARARFCTNAFSCHAATRGTGLWLSRRHGLHIGRDRAQRNPIVSAARYTHPRDAGLVEYVDACVCSRRSLCGVADGHLICASGVLFAMLGRSALFEPNRHSTASS